MSAHPRKNIHNSFTLTSRLATLQTLQVLGVDGFFPCFLVCVCFLVGMKGISLLLCNFAASNRGDVSPLLQKPSRRRGRGGDGGSGGKPGKLEVEGGGRRGVQNVGKRRDLWEQARQGWVSTYLRAWADILLPAGDSPVLILLLFGHGCMVPGRSSCVCVSA